MMMRHMDDIERESSSAARWSASFTSCGNLHHQHRVQGHGEMMYYIRVACQRPRDGEGHHRRGLPLAPGVGPDGLGVEAPQPADPH